MSEPEPLVRFRNNFPAKNATDIKKAYAKMQGISSGNPKGGSTTQPMVQEAFRMGVMKTVPNAKLFDADDIAEIFNYMDTDGDGSISCRDFINKVRVSP
jgi:hypothetical protein